MFKKLKKPNGITLIALIITIIVLLILAGVSISLVVGDNGVLTQASSSVVKNREAKAKEEVQLAWSSTETKYFTDWAANTSVDKDDYYGDEVLLTSYTSDTGTVESSVKNSDGKSWTVKYRAKDQNQLYTFIIDERGNVRIKSNIEITEGPIEILQGSTNILSVITISEDLLDKEIIWESDNANVVTLEGNGKTAKITGITNGIAKIKAKSGEAISNECTIIIYNKVSDLNISEIEIKKGENYQIQIPEGTEIVESYMSTNQDYVTVSEQGLVSGILQTNDLDISILLKGKLSHENKTISVIVTKSELAMDNLNTGDYVKYIAKQNTAANTNEILCKVMYNDEEHGLQLVSVNPVELLYFGSYGNAMEQLNIYTDKYKDSNFIALDTRCIGTIGTIEKDELGRSVCFNNRNIAVDNNGNEVSSSQETDYNYVGDLKQLGIIKAAGYSKSSKGTEIGGRDYAEQSCILASRVCESRSTQIDRYMRTLSYKGSLGKNLIYYTTSGGNGYSQRIYGGLRPIFLIASDVKVTGSEEGLGTESNPYELTKGN